MENTSLLNEAVDGAILKVCPKGVFVDGRRGDDDARSVVGGLVRVGVAPAAAAVL